MNLVFDLYERKCPVCGKTFEASIQHVYRIGDMTRGRVKWFCSWTCYRKFKRKAG